MYKTVLSRTSKYNPTQSHCFVQRERQAAKKQFGVLFMWLYAAVQDHCNFCSSAASFRQVQNTSIAASNSATGGRLGAMRMLLSCGSLP